MPPRPGFVLPALAFGVWVVLRLSLIAAGAETGQHITIRLDGHDVSVLLLRGDEPRRTLVVASHGGLATKETLLPVCWEARQRGADCVLVDALGHGASSELPAKNVVGAMREALRVDRALGPYGDVRYIGHSMGAYLGAGAVFPCERSVSIGQTIPCEARRMVWGDVHRGLGLPEVFYLPVSHLLEPWTPSVVREAVSRVLPSKASAATAARIALAWASFAATMVFGVLLARQVRASRIAPALRGAAAAAVLWGALAAGAWRTLWYLVPTQRSDVVMIACVLLASLATAAALRRLGLRSPLAGVALAALASEGAAVLAWRSFHVPLVGRLVVLLPLLGIVLVIVVTIWERLSRGRNGSECVESASFCSMLLGTFLALLLPGR